MAWFSPCAIWCAVANCKCNGALSFHLFDKSLDRAKYPLAVTQRLIEIFGSDVLIGYDIGCGFSVTANNSPTIGPEIRRANLSFCVNAFHGHAHHRRCQLRWHPLYITGVGLEDFETCERVFSESNKIAACTRLASTFHHRQAILRHFRRWNAEKYAGLSK